MKDSSNSVIYVGKSKNLKNRLGSYFHNSKSHSPKVQKLVKNLKDFDYTLTDTEFEAFMLECKLIKEIKPRYNRQMKSPNSYTYIKLNVNEKHPDIELSNECSKEDRNIYFGPYTNRNTVERGIEGIKECCKILCNNSSRKASSCLYYSLGTCIGMCLQDTPSKEYLDIYNKIISLLNGSDKSILEVMEYNMNNASEKFDFERAIKYRDYLSAVSYLISKGKVIEYTKENKNIVLLEHLSDNTFKFFLIKGNKVLFTEKYILTASDVINLKTILLNKILIYFNDKTLNASIEIKKEDIDESQIIYSYLKNKATSCKHFIVNEKWLNKPDNLNLNKALDELLITQVPCT